MRARARARARASNLSPSPSTSMFASISRGGSRIGKPYICSSCQSGLLAHADSQFARLAANRVLQAARFSTTGYNGKSPGGKHKNKSSKSSTETGPAEGFVGLLKGLQARSRAVFRQFQALTSHVPPAKEGAGKGGGERESLLLYQNFRPIKRLT